jgi:hypothetical protein
MDCSGGEHFLIASSAVEVGDICSRIEIISFGESEISLSACCRPLTVLRWHFAKIINQTGFIVVHNTIMTIQMFLVARDTAHFGAITVSQFPSTRIGDSGW